MPASVCRNLNRRLRVRGLVALMAGLLASSTGGWQVLAQTTTLTANVRRVSVDVVVTDAKGLPVAGLTEEDFKVEEDRVPQALRSFDVHMAAAAGSFAAPKIPALPPNTFLNLETVPEAGTPTVLLYDALNTSLNEQSYARRQLLQFIKHRRPGTQIALFVLGPKLRLLQGFTQDTDLLSTALDSKQAKTHALALQGGSNEVAPTPGGMDGDPVFDKLLADFALMDKFDQLQAAGWRMEVTIHALAELGRFLATVPGRKNLIWYSSTFQAGIFRSDSYHDPRNDSREWRQARDLLALSQTAVYPVDVKGVQANPAFSANKNASFGFDGGAIRSAQRKVMIQDNSAYVGMELIAEATGGHAYYGTNDLEEAVGKAMANGSAYYSLTYEPTNPKYDGSMRHIKVTLNRPGYNLAYRKTYYADDLHAAARAVADAPESPLAPALERGIPLSQGLVLESHLEVSGAPVAATAEQMQVLSQYGAMREQRAKRVEARPAPVVTMQQYLISYGLLARQLDLSVDATGARRALLEFGVISYDEDGQKLNGVDTRIDDAIPAERYAKLVSDGYYVGQAVAVPVGAASLRLAVRDVRSGRVGSLEVKLPLAEANARVAETKLAGK